MSDIDDDSDTRRGHKTVYHGEDGKRYGTWSEMAVEIEYLRTQMNRLKAIVDTIPKDREGVPITNGCLITDGHAEMIVRGIVPDSSGGEDYWFATVYGHGPDFMRADLGDLRVIKEEASVSHE